MSEFKTAFITLLLTVSTFACRTDAESVEPAFDDRADVSGFDIVDIEVGQSVAGLSVEKLGVAVSSAKQSDLQRSIVLLKLHLSSDQSASVVMRAASAGLDSYLIVKDAATGLNIGKSDDQKVVTSLGSRDSLVSLQGGDSRDVVIFASGGLDLHTAGEFTIDVVKHAPPEVDLHIDSIAVETYYDRMRSSEEELARWISLAYVLEKSDGFLEKNLDSIRDLPLAERVEIMRSLDGINDNRADLVDALIDRSDSEIATRESVGQALAAIYDVSRNSQ